MRPRICLAFAFLLSSVPVWAGEVYSFTLERHEGLEDQLRKGRVLIEGDRLRLELEPEEAPRPFDVLISSGVGGGETGLDLAGRTYFKLKEPDPAKPMAQALWLYWWDRKSVTMSDVKVDTRDAPEPETVSGLSTRRHETRAAYKVKVRFPGETLKGQVTIEEVAWVAEDRELPVPSLLRIDIHTAFPEVDGPLNQAHARLHGFPVKSQVTIDIDMGKGSERQTYSYAVTFRDLKPAETADPLFQVPSGFRYEEPVTTGPGMVPHS